jgi:hypothetical protein
MRSHKVFISGRIAGLPRPEAVRNFERGVRLCMNNTYDFVNPLELVPENASECEAMTILLPILTKQCDAILLMNDSKFSPGSHVEEKVAKYCKKMIFYEDDLTS